MEIPVEAPITAVTVYNDRALILRSARVEIPEAGEHVIKVGGLPQRLERNSLRAAGRGSAGTRILGIEQEPEIHVEPPVEELQRLEREITRLRRQTDYQQRLVVRRLESVLETRSDAEPDADLRLALLRRCMEALDDRNRKLLTQRYDTGLPIEDIARNEDRSAVAIRKHLFLLRAKLLDCVRSKLAAETR